MHCMEMDNSATAYFLLWLAIAELINKVFELESHSLVLECKELEEAPKKGSAYKPQNGLQ